MEDRLERALGGWAAANRIEGREAERIRTAILLTPRVDALWWDQFNQQMARLAGGAGRLRAGEPASLSWGERARVSWGVAA
jgi:hypothetical protein